MRVLPGLKTSVKLANSKGIKLDLPTAHRANRAGLIVAWCGVLCLAVLFMASCSHADMVDMDIISMIESSGCKNLVGDGGKALGCHQLHAGVVTDFNRAHGMNWHHKEMMIESVSNTVSYWYMNKRIPQMLKHYKQPDTLENRLTAYNMGIGNVVKGKRATAYINKYKKLKG